MAAHKSVTDNGFANPRDLKPLSEKGKGLCEKEAWKEVRRHFLSLDGISRLKISVSRGGDTERRGVGGIRICHIKRSPKCPSASNARRM